MAGRIPGCDFAVIAGAGHCAYWERPAEWNRAVVDFLRRYM
jgi:pimeloyl-ACP methyl ester carboxylesterase